ncbi:MAG: organomercurial lyase [Actinomycetota bacterium]|nr:organomercurial lyase [Actinomycetota bacterium]
MDESDVALRNATYHLFVDLGRAPSAEELAQAAGLAREEVVGAWRRLHDAHALVLRPDADEILMGNPFSAIPTPYRVQAAGRWWYGNCAWDAFGICAALHVDGEIETACADCGDPIAVQVRAGCPDDATLLFHCLVPAAQWWNDIVFT